MRSEQRIRTPHKSGESWWYEESWGIGVYNGNIKGCIRIRWSDLLHAFKRRAEIKEAERHMHTTRKVPH
jgi:hypothetical protein